ncbi:uncharacterized protein DFL_007083 [Arthrobotrys flagrans]|uniref:HCP-like protein n=1 Tax=Arthrobotrys flagrans TaxID=97331 RepID=A0A436ZV76_ARTFL|nr:hypothetical protein DFL_007083 [Arthrobotrys flagrans]
MPFGFHKKDKEKDYVDSPHPPPPGGYDGPGRPQNPSLQTPEFRMFRSDTTTQEEIFPPSHPHHNPPVTSPTSPDSQKPHKKRLSFLRRGSSSGGPPQASGSSEHVPTGLISPTTEGNKGEQEDKWEWRASQLGLGGGGTGNTPTRERSRSRSRSFSDQGTDKDIQEAIRLHEAGDLENSTKLFRQLADPQGANNPLSQVLYGLALRHGWGTAPNSAEAIKYLQAAAANSASIEQEALRAGMKKGGAAKGELVLAIFELGNCFRHGWGTEKDPVAAFNYYQTAANLGDTDAMNETAWCYLNGYGLKKKDKWLAAKYYRLAEENGNKTVGNSWIYKDKYVNPPK